MKNTYELIAPCHFGLESVLKREIYDLGYDISKVEDGKVTFIGDADAIARANIFLRTAERVLLKVGEFKATTFTELFDNTKELEWEEFIPKNGKFWVTKANSINSKLFSSSDIQSIVKKAIVERLKVKYAVNWFEEDGNSYPIRVSLMKDVVTISLDTSGDSLHKRGYRPAAGKAPISETLAAALIMLTPWKSDRILIDPFCGSGTFPIEAAMIAANIAPGMNRRFTSLRWTNIINNELWDNAVEEAEDLINLSIDTDIQGFDIDENSIYDIQVKRLHEYKRQQMNALYVIHKYFEIKEGKKPATPITVFFGAKAAPAYIIAKDIIHLILCLQQIINNDLEVSPYLKVFMVENYNVTMAEKMIPACDISEQISLASKEASGTGNMKFMLNGALTLGTMDGANVEIAELVGNENIFTFGEDSQTVIDRYARGDYNSRSYYEKDSELKRAVDFIVSDTVKSVGCSENLERLYNELLNKDWFMTFPDFEEYIATREKAYAAYTDRKAWAKKALINISKAGFFSSDRTIEQYNKEIWKLS